MSQNFMLELPALPGAKICSTECVYRQNDGSIEALKSGLVSCVGCGKPCHMQCHKVSGELLDAVRTVPKNNRCNAYFGEANNVRIVCDNCLTWLSCEVPTDVKSSFLLVFSRIAAKLISERYADSAKSSETSITRKRRLVNGGETMNVDAVTELKDMIQKCLTKIEETGKKSEEGVKGITSQLGVMVNHIDSTVKKESDIIVDCVKLKCNEIDIKMIANEVKMSSIATKLEEKIELDLTVVENVRSNGGLGSPSLVSTPNRRINREIDTGSTVRRRAMINNARSMLLSGGNETPRTALVRNNGHVLPTISGTADNDNIFGPSVQRFNRGYNENDENGNNSQRTGSQFKKKQAIYLRYVSSSITIDNMKEILKRDARIGQSMEENESNVEITRLVKKDMTEEMLSRRKYGISYRIGCSDELYPIINDPSFWASHWEIRPWNEERRVVGMGSIDEAKNHPNMDHNHRPKVQRSILTEEMSTT